MRKLQKTERSSWFSHRALPDFLLEQCRCHWAEVLRALCPSVIGGNCRDFCKIEKQIDASINWSMSDWQPVLPWLHSRDKDLQSPAWTAIGEKLRFICEHFLLVLLSQDTRGVAQTNTNTVYPAWLSKSQIKNKENGHTVFSHKTTGKDAQQWSGIKWNSSHSECIIPAACPWNRSLNCRVICS